MAILREAGWAVAEAGAAQTLTPIWNQVTGSVQQIKGSGFNDDARYETQAQERVQR